LAERFLGTDERALLPDNPVVTGLDKDYREAMKDPETRARVLMVNLRTRYIDQHMLDAVKAGASQVVILGAGFESRAYRFRKELKGTKVFEWDGVSMYLTEQAVRIFYGTSRAIRTRPARSCSTTSTRSLILLRMKPTLGWWPC